MICIPIVHNKDKLISLYALHKYLKPSGNSKSRSHRRRRRREHPVS